MIITSLHSYMAVFMLLVVIAAVGAAAYLDKNSK